MKKNNNKGFTLMEMLIVVAIIAVLVAIAIPVFTNQLEKAREATDMANLRSAYAEVMACALTDSSRDTGNSDNGVIRTVTDGVATWSKTVTPTQKQKGWQTSGDLKVGGISLVADLGITTGTWTVSYAENSTTGNATIEVTK